VTIVVLTKVSIFNYWRKYRNT